MLWQRYVFKRGTELQDVWDRMYSERRGRAESVRLMYITGRGFDTRAQLVMSQYTDALRESGCVIDSAELLLVSFSGYELSAELKAQTEENSERLATIFSALGTHTEVRFGPGTGEEDDVSTSAALLEGTRKVLSHIDGHTDIVLDVSSLPRIVYVALMLAILSQLVPTGADDSALHAGGVNFQVLVGEDAALDSLIVSEDPGSSLVLIPGYSAALQLEGMQDWHVVWFPILGESRLAQFRKVMDLAIPSSAEVCPVLPHPSRDPRRADNLLLEYKEPLFDARDVPLSNVLLAHEAHPFEAYRQLLGAMVRYQGSMGLVGGTRMVVTPLASKLITLGAALACFEMKRGAVGKNYSVAIPYAEPRRYVVSAATVRESKPVVSGMLLTGDAYSA